MNCTRCGGAGVLNVHQIPDEVLFALEQSEDFALKVIDWANSREESNDVMPCDCCGDGEGWHGTPGEHDGNDYGSDGPYAYNGGLPECW
jgi:hypothetical protein